MVAEDSALLRWHRPFEFHERALTVSGSTEVCATGGLERDVDSRP